MRPCCRKGWRNTPRCLYAESHGARRNATRSAYILSFPLLANILKGDEIPLQQKTDLRYSSYALPAGFVCPQYAAEIDRRRSICDALPRVCDAFSTQEKPRWMILIRSRRKCPAGNSTCLSTQWIRKYEIPRLKILRPCRPGGRRVG